METKVVIIIPDKDDSYNGRYAIYLHDMAGDILAAIHRKNGELDIIKERITKDIAERLFSEFIRESKIDELVDEKI